MSTNPDATAAAPEPGSQPGLSEEEARKLVEQLRSTPAERVIAEVFSSLLSAAEVKLGRRDARLFIDLSATVLDQCSSVLSEDLRTQVENALGQLRMGQVSAENQVATQEAPEANDLDRAPTPPKPASETRAPSNAVPSPASRLWVPGRP